MASIPSVFKSKLCRAAEPRVGASGVVRKVNCCSKALPAINRTGSSKDFVEEQLMAAALPAGVLLLRKTKQGLPRDLGKAGSSSAAGVENKLMLILQKPEEVQGVSVYTCNTQSCWKSCCWR